MAFFYGDNRKFGPADYYGQTLPYTKSSGYPTNGKAKCIYDGDLKKRLKFE